MGVRYAAYVQIGTGEYAIHGTVWPNWVKLRAAVSLCCIRMLNSDVIQVYNRIKVGTPVVVTKGKVLIQARGVDADNAVARTQGLAFPALGYCRRVTAL